MILDVWDVWDDAPVPLRSQAGGVAVWSAIRGGSEFRHPLDTHLQALPSARLRFPLSWTFESVYPSLAIEVSCLFYTFIHRYNVLYKQQY